MLELTPNPTMDTMDEEDTCITLIFLQDSSFHFIHIASYGRSSQLVLNPNCLKEYNGVVFQRSSMKAFEIVELYPLSTHQVS